MRNASLIAAALLVGCSGARKVPDAAEPRASATAGSTARLGAEGSPLRGQTSALHGETSGLMTRVTPLGTVVELPADTLFAFDKADLSPDAMVELTKAADAIRQAPVGPIAITGHTDALGDDAYNQRLSERRAAAVADVLRVQVGVRERSFTVAGKGESEPIMPNARADGTDDPAARARNRRVELLLPNPG